MSPPVSRTRWVIHLPIVAPDLTRAQVFARTAARTLAHLTRSVDLGGTTVAEEDDQGVRHRVFCDARLVGGQRCVLTPGHSAPCASRLRR